MFVGSFTAHTQSTRSDVGRLAERTTTGVKVGRASSGDSWSPSKLDKGHGHDSVNTASFPGPNLAAAAQTRLEVMEQIQMVLLVPVIIHRFFYYT